MYMDSIMLMATIVPVTSMVMVFGIVYLYKRENIAMIEKGMNPKIYRPAPFVTLKYALLLTGSGVGLLIAYIIDSLHPNFYNSGNPFLYIALVAIFGGIGLIISYRIEKKELGNAGNDERV